MSTTDYLQFHIEESARAARAAHAQMMRATMGGEGSMEFYVYFRPMRLEAFPDRPDGWSLAWAERVPSHFTEDQLVCWFAERSGRVPYLLNE